VLVGAERGPYPRWGRIRASAQEGAEAGFGHIRTHDDLRPHPQVGTARGRRARGAVRTHNGQDMSTVGMDP